MPRLNRKTRRSTAKARTTTIIPSISQMAEANRTTGKAKMLPMEYSQPDSQKMVTAWDKCLLAKFSPGSINAPLVAGMNVAPFPTLISVTSGSETRADLYGQGFQPIGTQDYLLIAYCPVASIFFGDGNTVLSNYPTNTKLGGLIYSQFSATSQVAIWP